MLNSNELFKVSKPEEVSQSINIQCGTCDRRYINTSFMKARKALVVP